MKILRKILIVFITFILLINSNIVVFANRVDDSIYTSASSENNNIVIVTEDGIYIDGSYYTQEQFIQLLEKAQPVGTSSFRSATASLIAGTWWIPGVGKVVITAAGVVIVGGAVISAGTWVYKQVTQWFAQRAEIAAAKAEIPNRLKDANGNVKIGSFNQKVRGKTSYKEPGGWEIDKDTSGHKGAKWKLKNKSQKRVASFDENGRVVGK